MTRIIAIFAALVLTGCATNYDAYVAAQKEIIAAQSQAETNRLLALTRIAESGDASAKGAAVMAIALSASKTAPVSLRPPESAAMEWARILVPAATNLYGARLGYGIQKMQIASEESKYGLTLDTLGGIAGQGIDAAGTVVFPPVYAPAGSLQSVD
jgi:hypothetical protein